MVMFCSWRLWLVTFTFFNILCCIALNFEEDVKAIKGLAQLGQNRLIYTDNRNHCVRKLEARSGDGSRSWISSTLAGRCSESGDVDGNKAFGRLRHPLECKHYKNSIFLTDNWSKIKQINLLDESLTTIHESPTQRRLRFFEFGTSPKEFYVTANQGAVHVIDGKESWLIGIDAPNFNRPMQIVWLNNEILLVADTFTHTLKTVDVNLYRVETICNGMYALNAHT